MERNDSEILDPGDDRQPQDAGDWADRRESALRSRRDRGLWWTMRTSRAGLMECLWLTAQMLNLAILLSANLGVMNLPAAAGAGRRTAGISLRGSSAKEKGSAGKGRICAFCRDRASYDPDGGCNVQ